MNLPDLPDNIEGEVAANRNNSKKEKKCLFKDPLSEYMIYT